MASRGSKRRKWRRRAARLRAREDLARAKEGLPPRERKRRLPPRKVILEYAELGIFPPRDWPPEAQQMALDLRSVPPHLRKARLDQMFALREKERKHRWWIRTAYGEAALSLYDLDPREVETVRQSVRLPALPPLDLPAAAAAVEEETVPSEVVDEIRQAALAAMSRGKANSAARIRAHAREWPWPSIIEKAKERIKRDPRFVPAKRPAKRQAEATQGAGVA